MKFKLLIALVVGLASCSQSSKTNDESSDETANSSQRKIADSSAVSEAPGVYFVNLRDGDKVKSPVVIQMGIRGMSVEPAGSVNVGKGHHHIIIDGAFIENGQTVPMDKTHLHFGKGQTTDTLKLTAGQHTLTLQFANGVHDSYGKDWSKTILITVMK